MGFGFTVGVVGVLILSHAAYSTIQWLVLCMWVGLAVPGKFLSINPDSEENRLVSLPENLDFMIFNHRSHAFPARLDVKLKHRVW